MYLDQDANIMYNLAGLSENAMYSWASLHWVQCTLAQE